MELTKALEAIKAYHNKLGYDYKYPSVEAQMEHVRALALALNMEVAECIDWLPFKPWRNIEDQTFNVPEAALELVDIFFFTIALWQALGLPLNSFEEMFELKLKENLDRIKRGYNKT